MWPRGGALPGGLWTAPALAKLLGWVGHAPLPGSASFPAPVTAPVLASVSAPVPAHAPIPHISVTSFLDCRDGYLGENVFFGMLDEAIEFLENYR